MTVKDQEAGPSKVSPPSPCLSLPSPPLYSLHLLWRNNCHLGDMLTEQVLFRSQLRFFLEFWPMDGRWWLNGWVCQDF